MKNKLTKDIFIASLVTIMMALSILTLLNTLITPAYAEEPDIMPFGIIDGRGSGGSGTYDDPYYENPWNGSIKIYDFLESIGTGGIYVELLVDPRNNISNDDVLINFKFKHKYIITQNYTPEYIQGFATFFYSPNNPVDKNDNSILGDKHSGTLGITSGVNGINHVKVHVRIRLKTGNEYNKYFNFGFGADEKGRDFI